MEDYLINLQLFFRWVKEVLPKETLFIWNKAMPLAEKLRGGFLIEQIDFMNDVVRLDVMVANYHAAQAADVFGLDVLDLHFNFRNMLHHRKKDGVHWDARVHRCISNALMKHVCQAWGHPLPERGNSAVTYNQSRPAQPVNKPLPANFTGQQWMGKSFYKQGYNAPRPSYNRNQFSGYSKPGNSTFHYEPHTNREFRAPFRREFHSHEFRAPFRREFPSHERQYPYPSHAQGRPDFGNAYQHQSQKQGRFGRHRPY
jgi:hypothetical protein